jgi:hypothetical protein
MPKSVIKPKTQAAETWPSEGTALLILQMAIRGADADEIEATLIGFGVEDPREAIERVLEDRPVLDDRPQTPFPKSRFRRRR